MLHNEPHDGNATLQKPTVRFAYYLALTVLFRSASGELKRGLFI